MSGERVRLGTAHIREWGRLRETVVEPLFRKAEEKDYKEAKALADIVKICQEGERRAAMFCGEDGEFTIEYEDGETLEAEQD